MVAGNKFETRHLGIEIFVLMVSIHFCGIDSCVADFLKSRDSTNGDSVRLPASTGPAQSQDQQAVDTEWEQINRDDYNDVDHYNENVLWDQIGNNTGELDPSRRIDVVGADGGEFVLDANTPLGREYQNTNCQGANPILITSGGSNSIGCPNGIQKGQSRVPNADPSPVASDSEEKTTKTAEGGQCVSTYTQAQRCCADPAKCLTDSDSTAKGITTGIGVGTSLLGTGAVGSVNNVCGQMAAASGLVGAANGVGIAMCLRLRNQCMTTCTEEANHDDDEISRAAKVYAGEEGNCKKLDGYLGQLAVFGASAAGAMAQAKLCEDATAGVASVSTDADYGKPNCSDPAQASNPLCRNCSGPNAATDPACAGLFPPTDGTLGSRSGTEDKDGDGAYDGGGDDMLFGQGLPGGGGGPIGNKANVSEAGGGGIPGGGGAASSGAAGGQGGGVAGKPNFDGTVTYGRGGGGSMAGGRGYVSGSSGSSRGGAGGSLLGDRFNIAKYLPGQGKGKALDKRIGARGLAGAGGIGKASGNIWLSVSTRYKQMCSSNLLYDCKGK